MSEQSKIGIFKFLSSATIVGLQTFLFSYCLFFVYNKELTAPLDSGGYLMIALYFGGLAALLSMMGALKIEYNKQWNIVVSHIVSMVFINVLFYLQLSLIHRGFLPIHQMVILTVLQFFVCILWTVIVFHIKGAIIRAKDLLLIYGDKKAEELVYKVLEREDQYIIRESIQYVDNSLDLGNNLEAVKAKIMCYKSVIICRLDSTVRNDILKFCYENNIEVYLPPRISDIIIRGGKEMNQLDSPLIMCHRCNPPETQLFFKRVFDIVVSLFGIIISSPIMLTVAIAIKVQDGGKVFFKQKRVTKDEKVFEILKFRSMIIEAEKDGDVIPAGEVDPRITPIGKVIRRLRIDELPQLFNILKGDMSVVGPRPERVEHHEAYTKVIAEFPYRTKVKAGLTGYAQVMGKYNTSPYDKLLLDLEYIQKFSIFLDCKLLLLTAKIIFMKESTEGFKDNSKED